MSDSRDLLAAVVRFCRALRDRGVPAGSGEAILAARALDHVDLSDRQEVYLALRAVLAGRVEDHAAFDEVFDAVWVAGADDWDPGKGMARPGREPARSRPESSTPRSGAATAVSLERWLRPDAAGAERLGLPTVSDQEVLATKDFSTYGSEELDQVVRAAARLARRLADRPGRRWKPTRRGPRADPRRTLRRSFRTGGDAVEMVFRVRRPKRTKLIVVCDVSGSMDLYSRLLLQFLYALQNGFARVETFVFSTRLSRVTEQLRVGDDARGYARALERLSADVRDWSGGTRIGESLAEFQRRWGRLVERRTILIVLSDGWDTGDPEVLASALRTLRRRAGRLIWLNPLLGSPDYRPLTRGMQAALPHVDVFAPAHDLASLNALVRHLKL